jgi:DNA-directed RNA polymerase specialized sigma24 family protein
MGTSKQETTTLDWIADLSRRLTKKGTTLEALARAAAKPRVLDAIVRSIAEEATVDLPTNFHPDGIASLLRHLFGREWAIRRSDSSDQERATQDAIAEYMRKPDKLRHLLQHLSPRYRTIIMQVHGLADGKPQTATEIGERFGVSCATISAQLKKAAAQLRRRHKYQLLLDQTALLPILERPVEVLDLSDRAYQPIKDTRGSMAWRYNIPQINTVGDLCSRTKDDLLGLSNFGDKALDEVIEKLAAHNLSLAPDPT